MANKKAKPFSSKAFLIKLLNNQKFWLGKFSDIIMHPTKAFQHRKHFSIEHIITSKHTSLLAHAIYREV